MTKDEAKEILKFHNFSHDDIHHPKMKKGFLGMLRPFSGELYEENHHEVIAVMKVLANDLRENEKIDREVLSALWGICHLTKSWAIDSDGMLQRNDLIKKEQVKKLEKWIEAISYATMMLLDGQDNKIAFDFYEN